MSYDDLDVHVMMLRDEPRTEAYRRALSLEVRPDDLVLDFGCGTGILSFFAARAGARKVYAVDRSRMIKVAERVGQQNGFENITFMRTDGDDLVLPEKVDVLVSEWMGGLLFEESMFETLIDVRDRWLKPGGRMLPSRVSTHCALVRDRVFWDDIGFLRERPYDVDFSAVSDWPYRTAFRRTYLPRELFPFHIPTGEVDMQTCPRTPPILKGSVRPPTGGPAYGIVGWFDCDVSKAVRLETGPNHPTTHWEQMYFPFVEPFDIEEGVDLSLYIHPLRLGDQGKIAWEWGIEQGGRKVVQDDHTHREWVDGKPFVRDDTP
jgi:SAM-dependent methyltransferase